MTSAESRATLKTLIAKAQVCGLHHHPEINEQSRILIKSADQEKRMLHKKEIESICMQSGTNQEASALIISEAAHYVDRCKQTLQTQQAHLFEEGGALHPTERAEACWRDCWNFLRVASYAMASDTPDCTDASGIQAVRQLYALMNVPAAGMTLALQTLSQLITTDLLQRNHQREALCLEKAFAHLNSELHKG